jgi:TetR/AcrR family transcriptional regulator, cholesterol catabolism regulator
MDEKKSEIIVKASGIFMRYGIKSVTMDDIARELGISKKTIYIFFRDKDDLVTEIIKAKTTADKCECEKVRDLSGNAIDEMFGISKMIIAKISSINPSVFYDLQKYHPGAWEVMHQHRWDFVYKSFHANLVRGMKEGVYRQELDPEIISRLNASMTDMIFNGKTFSTTIFKYELVFDEMFRFQIHGMANEKGLSYLMSNYKKN